MVRAPGRPLVGGGHAVWAQPGCPQRKLPGHPQRQSHGSLDWWRGTSPGPGSSPRLGPSEWLWPPGRASNGGVLRRPWVPLCPLSQGLLESGQLPGPGPCRPGAAVGPEMSSCRGGAGVWAHRAGVAQDPGTPREPAEEVVLEGGGVSTVWSWKRSVGVDWTPRSPEEKRFQVARGWAQRGLRAQGQGPHRRRDHVAAGAGLGRPLRPARWPPARAFPARQEKDGLGTRSDEGWAGAGRCPPSPRGAPGRPGRRVQLCSAEHLETGCLETGVAMRGFSSRPTREARCPRLRNVAPPRRPPPTTTALF